MLKSAITGNRSPVAAHPVNNHRLRRQILLIVLLAAVVSALSFMYLPLQMAAVAILTVLCIACWATDIVPVYWTAITFFLAVMIFGLAPSEIVFTGFASSTFWLLFSGLVMGAAIIHTGLDQRIASLLSRCLIPRYNSIITRIVLFGMALSFIMPAALGRIALLMPITMALATQMGYQEGSKGRSGILMAAAFGTFLPAFAILPANAPNMILAGMVENMYDYPLSYWSYLLLHFPVLGALKSLLLIRVLLWLFPDRDPRWQRPDEPDNTPVSPEQRRLIIVLGLSLLLWLTDTLHHISPGWVGLAAALYCLLPASRLTAARCINRDINYGTLFFVVGIIGLGSVISASGLGERVVQQLGELAHFEAGKSLHNVISLTLVSIIVAAVTNLPGVPAVMSPISQDLAMVTGLPLISVLMTQVLAFSSVLLPYQAPPLVAAIQLGKLSMIDMTRVCLTLFGLTLFVLLPLDLAWWALLGWL